METKRQFKPLPVFKAWKVDTAESLNHAMDFDVKNIAVMEIVSEDK